METRANYALIGLFTLAVIAAAFGFVYWFSGGDRGQASQTVRIVFSGSVSGLSKGSIVSFNGLRVGEVTELSLLPEDPRRVVSIAQLDGSTPIRADTRARLEMQGLTGVATIALSGGEPGSPPLVAGPGQPLPTIFADRSDFQDLIESARNIARRADDVLERVGRVISDNEGSINRTVQNVERFSQALGENAEGIDQFLAQVGQAAEKVGPLAEKLETLATNVDEVVRSVDRERVARIVENVDNFTQALGDSRESITTATRDAASLVGRLNQTAPRLEAAVNDIANITRTIDPAKVGRSIDNIDRVVGSVDSQRVARIVENTEGFTQALAQNREAINNALRDAASLVASLNQSAPKLDTALTEIGEVAKAIDPAKIGRTVDNVDTFTQTLSRRSPDVDKAIQEARSITEKLNKSADRIDAVLQGAEKFLGSASGESGKGAFDEIRAAAISVRELADDLNTRTEGVLKGFGRFTDSGLREYEALAVEGRRTLGDISRAVRSIERNPQQFLFGTQSNLPQYNGRR
ncbi:MlaD family protein [Microvirga aerophila]|uniref:Organic solvent ABC transporter substrate-binding protein n=1 Tax=Microvirga aerophila TaxID=670291 RepID=A0A512BK46_9HYPH|nr:MCE family protein [Microvirga aerophila]GEO12333.1 organic solvent ABC transporter substrate-binding protein [Microvirga aerophila]